MPTDMYTVCFYHNPVIFSFAWHSAIGVFNGAGIAYTFLNTWVHSRFIVAYYLKLCVVFCRPLYLCPFPLPVVLSELLRFTDSDYQFGIFTFLMKWIRFHWIFKNNPHLVHTAGQPVYIKNNRADYVTNTFCTFVARITTYCCTFCRWRCTETLPECNSFPGSYICSICNTDVELCG